MDDGARQEIRAGRPVAPGARGLAWRGQLSALAGPPPAGASLDLALELPQAILDHDLGEVRDDFPRDVAHHLVADQLDDPARDAIDVLVAQGGGAGIGGIGGIGGQLRGGLAVPRRGGGPLLRLLRLLRPLGLGGLCGGPRGRRSVAAGPRGPGRGAEHGHGLLLSYPQRPFLHGH